MISASTEESEDEFERFESSVIFPTKQQVDLPFLSNAKYIYIYIYFFFIYINIYIYKQVHDAVLKMNLLDTEECMEGFCHPGLMDVMKNRMNIRQWKGKWLIRKRDKIVETCPPPRPIIAVDRADEFKNSFRSIPVSPHKLILVCMY